MTARAESVAATFSRSETTLSTLLAERFGPGATLIHERADADALLAERFGPVDTLVLERVKAARPVKRPESAVQPSPAGSGHQSNDGPACAGMVAAEGDEPLWDFDAGEDANGRAKVICITCPMRQQCLGVGIRDKESGIWGGISLLDGAPHSVLRLTNMSTHRHRANGEPLCSVCIDAEAVRLQRRRAQDEARRKAKRAGVA